MLKKLRIKFIGVAMFAVSLVLVLLMGCINIVSYKSVVDNAEQKLDVLETYGGTFPYDNSVLNSLFRGKFSMETPFDSRYFTVTINAKQMVASVDIGHIASVDTDSAASLAYSLYQKGKTKGFTSNFRYRAVSTDYGTQYIFLDCNREMNTVRDFFSASMIISGICLLLVFIFVFIFSMAAIKPTVEAYTKQKRFITDAGHELKTPLAIISAANEVIELDNGENEWTESIRNQIKRLSSLIEKLVMLAKMDEETVTKVNTKFSLSNAVKETAESFSAVAAARNRTLVTEIEPSIEFTGDENSIRQLTSLLTDNAMKYSNDGGTVRVTLRRSGKKNELTVFNTVEHIEKGEHREFFERFYRADGSRSVKTGGHGIGLSVAEAIVTAHKGKITAVAPDEKSVYFRAVI
jgi:two-component system, OmpR family, sensor histidine kinase CiaH